METCREREVVMSIKTLKEYLDGKNIKYVSITHSPAFTAQQIAASAHVPGKELAKTVMVKIDGELAMAVLPASFKVDFELLKKVSGAKNAELAREHEFKDTFPDCDVGAMPPFGNLYGLKVFVAESLTGDEDIAFNACSHVELIRMPYKDFERLVKPTIAKISYRL
jgi:Ala-tRNA(Pro) deacylase